MTNIFTKKNTVIFIFLIMATQQSMSNKKIITRLLYIKNKNYAVKLIKNRIINLCEEYENNLTTYIQKKFNTENLDQSKKDIRLKAKQIEKKLIKESDHDINEIKQKTLDSNFYGLFDQAMRKANLEINNPKNILIDKTIISFDTNLYNIYNKNKINFSEKYEEDESDI